MTRDMKLTNSIPDLHFHHRTRRPETDSSPFLDPSFSVHDDFLDQILSTIPPPSSPWELIHPSSLEIPTTSPDEITHSPPPPQPPPPAKVAMMMLQQQLLMSMANAAADDDSGQFQFCNDVVEDSSSFKCPNLIGDGLIPSFYNGFVGNSGPELNRNQNQNQSQHFHHPQVNSTQIQNFGIPNAIGNSNPSQSNIPAGHGAGGSSPAQPRQRVRARRGQATDPHSIAERLRRERIAERMKALQELVPNANKTDKASMLDEIIDYVRFLQLQVKVLSMSRLGGAAAPMPSLLAADISSEGGGGGGDCVQSNGNSGAIGRTSNGAPTPSSTDTMTVAEHQVIKLLEEDMGSAMQYLQGKGLCLMPISLATAISTTTCRSRNPIVTPSNGGGEGPTSPSMSVLTVQSATATFGNGTVERGASASVSKP